ncbi:MAG: hypothetical protein WD404_02635 [Solirubrobacterales bacterium]
MSVPWTQSLHLYWRPELRFYAKQADLLKQYEEQGVLRAFRIEEGFVDAQLFESRDRLTIKKDGVDLRLLSPRADPDRALEALDIAVKEVGPAFPRAVSASFQHIIEIDVDLDEAIKRGYGRILGDLPGRFNFGDWAVLTDVVVEGLDASGTIEFGIIRSDEAPMRLARLAGRAGEARQQSLARWQEEDFPDVAVFCDGVISGSLDSKTEGLAASATEFWNAARSAQESLADGLCAMLTADDLGRVEAK